MSDSTPWTCHLGVPKIHGPWYTRYVCTYIGAPHEPILGRYADKRGLIAETTSNRCCGIISLFVLAFVSFGASLLFRYSPGYVSRLQERQQRVKNTTGMNPPSRLRARLTIVLLVLLAN